MKNGLIFITLLLVCYGAKGQTITLSEYETMQVKESNVFWEAKFDTTLDYTLINARSIAVMNASFPKEKNVTKHISFKLRNAQNEGRTVNGRITGLVQWNDQQLYTVELEIGINLSTQWEYRKVHCALADLSESENQLIIGRNWLGNDVQIVD